MHLLLHMCWLLLIEECRPLQELERVRWEEQRKSMQQDAQTKAELSKYDDQLARARQADEHEKYRQRNAELVKMQEESSARQEQQRQIVAQQIEAERRATDQNKVHSCPSVCCFFLRAKFCMACGFSMAGRFKEGMPLV